MPPARASSFRAAKKKRRKEERQAPGGLVYHLLNRAVARLPLFEKPADYAAFHRVLGETLDHFPMRVLAHV